MSLKRIKEIRQIYKGNHLLLTKHYIELESSCMGQQEKINTLTKTMQRNEEVLREAVEFYADKKGWIPRSVGSPHLFNKVDTEYIPYNTVIAPRVNDCVGGRKARQALQNLEKVPTDENTTT